MTASRAKKDAHAWEQEAVVLLSQELDLVNEHAGGSCPHLALIISAQS